MTGPGHAGGSNYSIPVPGAPGSETESNPLAGFEDDLSRTIVDCEVNADQWTLMHRYNKATELLQQALNVSSPSLTARWAHYACHAPPSGSILYSNRLT